MWPIVILDHYDFVTRQASGKSPKHRDGDGLQPMWSGLAYRGCRQSRDRMDPWRVRLARQTGSIKTFSCKGPGPGGRVGRRPPGRGESP